MEEPPSGIPTELDLRDQDYRADMDQGGRPSNIIMLRMLPPNATVNEVRSVVPVAFAAPPTAR